MKLYFAYGSNLNLEQMRHRCDTARPYKAATLHGYALRYAGGGHADIVCAKRSVVHGALYEITERDEFRLDRYEGVSGGSGYYTKIQVSVKVSARRSIDTLTYVMRTDIPNCDPSDGYVLTCLIGMADWSLPVTGAVSLAVAKISGKRALADAFNCVRAVWRATTVPDAAEAELQKRTGQAIIL